MPCRTLAILLTLAAAGCGGPQVYRIRTNVPWPDQWADGPRQPDRTDLPLSAETVVWHQLTDLDELQRRIEDTASRHHGVLAMTRRSFADRQGKSGKPQHALPFLEVRVTAWPLPVAADRSRHDFSFQNRTLEEILKPLGDLLGTTFTLSEDVSPATRIDFSGRRLSAAEALALLLLQNDLYFAPVCLGTSVLRSYEFRSEEQFMQAVRRRLAEADGAAAAGPYLVMPLAEWVRHNRPTLQRIAVNPQDLPVRPPPTHDCLLGDSRRYLRRILELRCRSDTPPQAPGSAAANESAAHRSCSPPPGFGPAVRPVAPACFPQDPRVSFTCVRAW